MQGKTRGQLLGIRGIRGTAPVWMGCWLSSHRGTAGVPQGPELPQTPGPGPQESCRCEGKPRRWWRVRTESDVETVGSPAPIPNPHSECQVLNCLLIFKRKKLEKGSSRYRWLEPLFLTNWPRLDASLNLWTFSVTTKRNSQISAHFQNLRKAHIVTSSLVSVNGKAGILDDYRAAETSHGGPGQGLPWC